MGWTCGRQAHIRQRKRLQGFQNMFFETGFGLAAIEKNMPNVRVSFEKLLKIICLF